MREVGWSVQPRIKEQSTLLQRYLAHWVPNQASLKPVAVDVRRPWYRCSRLLQERLMLKERPQLWRAA